VAAPPLTIAAPWGGMMIYEVHRPDIGAGRSAAEHAERVQAAVDLTQAPTMRAAADDGEACDLIKSMIMYWPITSPWSRRRRRPDRGDQAGRLVAELLQEM
jgi:hypothetical protein